MNTTTCFIHDGIEYEARSFIQDDENCVTIVQVSSGKVVYDVLEPMSTTAIIAMFKEEMDEIRYGDMAVQSREEGFFLPVFSS